MHLVTVNGRKEFLRLPDAMNFNTVEKDGFEE